MNAPTNDPLLLALLAIERGTSDEASRRIAQEAIEYATGAHDPSSYPPEDGYEVDAAGTFKG